MRIAFLADGSHPNCFRWAEHYAARGAVVAVFDFIPERFERQGVHYIPIPSGRWAGKLRYLLATRAARRVVAPWRPDLVIGYRLVSFGYLAARCRHRPLVLAAQGQNLVPPGAPPFVPIMVRHALAKADLLHAWSTAMADKMVEFGANPGKILVRPRGISLDKFRPAGARAERPTIISTRLLEPYYNQTLLIEGVARLLGAIPSIELVLVGRGSNESSLRRRVSELRLDANVRFAGFLDTGALVNELQRAWLYVSAVPTDGVSSALLEAMACGCFPVVVDNRANRDWIESGRNGLLFAEGDTGAFAENVTRALSDLPLLASARRENARVLRERADWERNMTEFLSAYDSLIARFERER